MTSSTKDLENRVDIDKLTMMDKSRIKDIKTEAVSSSGFTIDTILSRRNTSPRTAINGPVKQLSKKPKTENLDIKNEDDDDLCHSGNEHIHLPQLDNTYNSMWLPHRQHQQMEASSFFYSNYHYPHHHHPYHQYPHPGFPVSCPVAPGRVHPFNCPCSEQFFEQPYFLLTPAGYSIPSPVSSGCRLSTARYSRRRKARTVFNDYQLRRLEARFIRQRYLSTPERIELAHALFLTESQVKTWFQNRRMKQKKLLRDSGKPRPDRGGLDMEMEDGVEGDSNVEDADNEDDVDDDAEGNTSPVSMVRAYGEAEY